MMRAARGRTCLLSSHPTRSLLRGYLPSATQLILTLASHPSPPLSRLAPRISSLLESYPRSSSASYSTERAFLTAHATWRSQFRTVARTLGGSGWSREGEWEEFDGEGVALEDRVKEMLDILEGNEAQILAESADWREAVGAWGLWVRPGLKRDDLPETIQHIVAQLPEETRPDESTAEDSVQLALLQGKITHAITLAYPFSIWLVTHLTDLLDKLSLLEPPLPEHPRSMRDHFVLEYADHLESDPGLWRLACDYLGTAGDEGKHRIAAIVERVELDKERDEESEEEAESGDAAEPELDLEKVDEVFQM
jgi:nuclear pore complex protein Nup85